MTPAEADQRIILSRQTLAKYLQMAAVGAGPSPENLALFTEEVSILLRIAEEHPVKAAKIEALVGEWRRLQDLVKGRMN